MAKIILSLSLSLSSVCVDAEMQPNTHLLPLEAQHPGVVAQAPIVRLLPGQAGAVDARLLPCAEADDLAAVGVADGVALRKLQGNGGHQQVDLGRCGGGGAPFICISSPASTEDHWVFHSW